MTTTPPHWAICTHKGGVGKTLLLHSAAAAAAELGDRVLVVDMDAQGNATRRLAARLPAHASGSRAAASLAGVLERPARGEVARILVPCGWGGIYSDRIMVAPAHLELELLASTAARAGSERRLLTALAGVVDDFDVVMIDTPPNLLGHLIDNAWTAADVLFVSAEPEFDSIEAARRVGQRVAAERETLNPDLQVGGFVVNRYPRVGRSAPPARGGVASIAGAEAVCPVRLPELVKLKDAGEFAQPLAEVGLAGARHGRAGARRLRVDESAL